MREYDEMIARQVEQDGVRMASGHHVRSPIPRHTDNENLPDGWEQCYECGASWDTTIMSSCRYCRNFGPDAVSWVDRRDDDR